MAVALHFGDELCMDPTDIERLRKRSRNAIKIGLTAPSLHSVRQAQECIDIVSLVLA